MAANEDADFGKLKLDDLYLDIGASSEGEARKKVQLGDVAVYDTACLDLGGRIVSPYQDNRISCVVLLMALEGLSASKNDLYFVFTTQEEVGLRGATTAGYAADPDMAIALDVTHANDFPRTKETTHVVSRLGKGAAVKIMDRGLIAHPDVVEALEAAAAKAGVPCQREILLGGSTDAAAIHKSARACPPASSPCPAATSTPPARWWT